MCGCDHSRGQDCDWCNGINSELGLTYPSAEPLAPVGTATDDPWFDPTAARAEVPF